MVGGLLRVVGGLEAVVRGLLGVVGGLEAVTGGMEVVVGGLLDRTGGREFIPKGQFLYFTKPYLMCIYSSKNRIKDIRMSVVLLWFTFH